MILLFLICLGAAAAGGGESKQEERAAKALDAYFESVADVAALYEDGSTHASCFYYAFLEDELDKEQRLASKDKRDCVGVLRRYRKAIAHAFGRGWSKAGLVFEYTQDGRGNSRLSELDISMIERFSSVLETHPGNPIILLLIDDYAGYRRIHDRGPSVFSRWLDEVDWMKTASEQPEGWRFVMSALNYRRLPANTSSAALVGEMFQCNEVSLTPSRNCRPNDGSAIIVARHSMLCSDLRAACGL